eukprot:6152432-Heterocapsa_arctica.AAC.1
MECASRSILHAAETWTPEKGPEERCGPGCRGLWRCDHGQVQRKAQDDTHTGEKSRGHPSGGPS